MESTFYHLENWYSGNSHTRPRPNKELLAHEGLSKAEALLAEVTTRLDHAKHAYESLAYGTSKPRQQVALTGNDRDLVQQALKHYWEMIEAYGTVILMLQEDRAEVKPQNSLLDAFHERMHRFLKRLLLAWMDKLDK